MKPPGVIVPGHTMATVNHAGRTIYCRILRVYGNGMILARTRDALWSVPMMCVTSIDPLKKERKKAA